GPPGGLEYRAQPHPRSGADGTRRLAVDVRDPLPAPAVRGSATARRPVPGHDAPAASLLARRAFRRSRPRHPQRDSRGVPALAEIGAAYHGPGYARPARSAEA